MKNKTFIALTLFTIFFGVLGSLQADQQTREPSSIDRRPPLGDDGPGGKGGKN